MKKIFIVEYRIKSKAKFSYLLSHINMCDLKRSAFKYRMWTELFNYYNIPLATSWILAWVLWVSSKQTQSIFQVTDLRCSILKLFGINLKRNLNERRWAFFPQRWWKKWKHIPVYTYFFFVKIVKLRLTLKGTTFILLFAFNVCKITQRWKCINSYKYNFQFCWIT